HEEKGEGQVRNRVRVPPGRVEHGDTLLGRQREIDVDRVAAAAADHREPTALEHLRVYEVGLDDEDLRAELADVGGELRAVEMDRPPDLPVLVHDLHVACEPRLRALVEAGGDEGAHHAASRRWTSWITCRRTCSRSRPLRTLPPSRLWYGWL